MNYKKLYDNIITNRIQNPISIGYSEKHHILPRCLGGTDDPNNIVVLSAREHYLCHYLLTKIYDERTIEWGKMMAAFGYMNWGVGDHQSRYVNSRFYTKMKKNFSVAQSLIQTGQGNSQFNTIWIFNLELELSKKIKKTDLIPTGWELGRIVDFKKYKKTIEIAQLKYIESEKNKKDEIDRLYEIMLYYRDNNISMRQLTKMFNVGHNVYKRFEKYFKDEYHEIVKQKPMNSNTTKGRYKS